MNEFSFFATQGPLSRPGAHAELFDSLPADIGELCAVVQGVTVHPFWAERYGVTLAAERGAEVQLRTMEKRLARTLELDSRPLTVPRPLELKTVGNCRDHTLLLVSMLRSQGVPARARCGFGTYFLPGHFEDHWVAEYWNESEKRWILVDAQLDAFQRGVLNVSFDPLDVPRDCFIAGGAAWRMCREGVADPNAFGIFDMRGMGFVGSNLVRDVAALNKVELLPWDCWGMMLERDTDDSDLALLDRLAELTEGDVPDFESVRELNESDPRLKAGATIHSFVQGKMKVVKLEL